MSHNTGYSRAITYTLTKVVDGTGQTQYVYSLLNSFGLYPSISEVDFLNLSNYDYNLRMQGFYAYLSSIHNGFNYNSANTNNSRVSDSECIVYFNDGYLIDYVCVLSESTTTDDSVTYIVSTNGNIIYDGNILSEMNYNTLLPIDITNTSLLPINVSISVNYGICISAQTINVIVQPSETISNIIYYCSTINSINGVVNINVVNGDSVSFTVPYVKPLEYWFILYNCYNQIGDEYYIGPFSNYNEYSIDERIYLGTNTVENTYIIQNSTTIEPSGMTLVSNQTRLNDYGCV